MVTTPAPVRSNAHLARIPHFVYEFYDRDGDPVYVGTTVNLADRLRTHQASEMWREVAEVRSMLHPNRDLAQSVEAERIRTLQPRWNYQHTERASEAVREQHRNRREMEARYQEHLRRGPAECGCRTCRKARPLAEG